MMIIILGVATAVWAFLGYCYLSDQKRKRAQAAQTQFFSDLRRSKPELMADIDKQVEQDLARLKANP